MTSPPDRPRLSNSHPLALSSTSKPCPIQLRIFIAKCIPIHRHSRLISCLSFLYDCASIASVSLIWLNLNTNSLRSNLYRNASRSLFPVPWAVELTLYHSPQQAFPGQDQGISRIIQELHQFLFAETAEAMSSCHALDAESCAK